MKLDSEDQREFLLNIVAKSSISVTGEAIMSAAMQVETLKMAIANAEIEEIEETEDKKIAGSIEEKGA